MKPNKFYHLLFPCLLGGMLLFPTGCSNDDYDAVIDESEEKCIPIDITLSGIQTLFGPYGEEARNVQYNKIHETRDLDKSHILETLVMAEPDTLRPPLTRATSALTNTTLRLVAYQGSTYAGTGVYNISSTGEITSSEQLLLTKTGSYTFHCFSPAQSVTVSGNTVTVDLPAAGSSPDSVFYYAKTSNYSVTISPTGTNKTTITVPTLTPQYCKLTLNVDGTYTDAVVSTTLYAGASLTLPGGTVTSNTPVTTTTISSSAPAIYVYPGSTGRYGIRVNSWNVGGENKGDVTFDTNTSGMTLAAGNAYKVDVRYVLNNYIKIAELPFKVAYGNLLYNSSTGRWYMAPDQGYYYAASGGYETLTNNNSYGSSGDKVFSYINWGVQAKSPNFSLTSSGPYADAYGGQTANTHYGTVFGYNSKEATSADTDVSNYKNNNDPCYAALGGSWHLPTGGSSSSDLGYFAKASNTKGSFKTYTTKSNLSSSGTRTVNGHYFGTTTQPSSADQDKYVFLPAAGWRNESSGGAVGGGGSNGYGRYWCGTPESSDYAYVLDFESIRIQAGKVSYMRYCGLSLRCVGF